MSMPGETIMAQTEASIISTRTKYIAIPRLTSRQTRVPVSVLPPLSSSLSSSRSTAATEALRWTTVQARTAPPSTDLFFVYAVRSTGIYCRPTCPARLARRANITFYDTASAASTAGYRACKRCKPDLNYFDTTAFNHHGETGQKVAKACESIALAFSCLYHVHGHGQFQCHGQDGRKCQRQRPNLRHLAAEAGLTPSHFHRVFKKVVGMTPGQYARDVSIKMKEAGCISIPSTDIIDDTSRTVESPLSCAEKRGQEDSSFSSSSSSYAVDASMFDDLVDWDWDEQLGVLESL